VVGTEQHRHSTRSARPQSAQQENRRLSAVGLLQAAALATIVNAAPPGRRASVSLSVQGLWANRRNFRFRMARRATLCRRSISIMRSSDRSSRSRYPLPRPEGRGRFWFRIFGGHADEVRSAVYRVDLLRPCGYWPSRRPPRWRRKFRRIPTNCSIRGSARRCYVARLCASDEMNRERSLNALLLKLTRENPAFTQLQSKLTRTLGTSFRLTVIATFR
jgi:hypothetical protein